MPRLTDGLIDAALNGETGVDDTDDSEALQYYMQCLPKENEYRREILDGDGFVPDDELVVWRLMERCDWTRNGADVLLMLAQRYGAFILRNALALARALDIEDGDLGL